MINVLQREGSIQIQADADDLSARDENQLAFWGFKYDPARKCFSCGNGDLSGLAAKVIAYFERHTLAHQVGPVLRDLLIVKENARKSLRVAAEKGRRLKNGGFDLAERRAFTSMLRRSVCRPLKKHQVKAALHLLATRNGANFSVPGSGKTAVVLTVFEMLRQLGEVDALFVVGPPACFGPWRTEYKAVLGTTPHCELLAGGDADLRRTKYEVVRQSVRDLYLTTFQTLHRDWQRVRTLFQLQGIRFYLVIDEAHYIKQLGGVWANAVLQVAGHASRRCILTGTPFPRAFTDAFNLFDVLWPEAPPISAEQRHRIELHTERNEGERAAQILQESIGALFYRVRKADLGLAPQIFEPLTMVRMNTYERRLYDFVLDRVTTLSQKDYSRNAELLARLKRGRITRLRQCVSYAKLLASAISEYKEPLVPGRSSMSDVIRHYDELETPAKVVALQGLIGELRGRGEKVVIWSTFVSTLKYIEQRVKALGHGVRMIYGGTPIQDVNMAVELTREEIIREFVDPTSGVDVLVANPAACAESISLHKACSHAIYYDLSYNCAQYLQSLDRIHRVGGSEHKAAHYYVLQYEDSLDSDILRNIRNKAAHMSRLIDKEYPVCSLDMLEDEGEVEAYDRLFTTKDK